MAKTKLDYTKKYLYTVEIKFTKKKGFLSHKLRNANGTAMITANNEGEMLDIIKLELGNNYISHEIIGTIEND